MLDLFKLLHRPAPQDDPETRLDDSSHSPAEVSGEYRALIVEQLERGGVSRACIEIEVRRAGNSRDGHEVYVGMLRLARWERASAVRLLLGLPILESRVRRLVRGSWLAEVSSFGGIWLHASGQLQQTRAMEDLRALVVEIEQHEDRAPASSGSGVWTLPTDMGALPD